MNKIYILLFFISGLSLGMEDKEVKDEMLRIEWSMAEEDNRLARENTCVFIPWVTGTEMYSIHQLLALGRYDQIREKYFPNAVMRIEADEQGNMHLHVTQAKLSEVVLYWNLCNAYTAILEERPDKYICYTEENLEDLIKALVVLQEGSYENSPLTYKKIIKEEDGDAIVYYYINPFKNIGEGRIPTMLVRKGPVVSNRILREGHEVYIYAGLYRQTIPYYKKFYIEEHNQRDMITYIAESEATENQRIFNQNVLRNAADSYDPPQKYESRVFRNYRRYSLHDIMNNIIQDMKAGN